MAEILKCGLCGAGRPRASCHIITLSLEERQQLRAMGQQPRSEYVYCKPCWRTLSNPVTAPAVLKGLVQTGLRQFGVENAEQVAQQYYNRLVERINKPRS